jgi:hypothetical protein
MYKWILTMPKGNPNPVMTEGFERSKFKRSDNTQEPLAEKLLCVRLTASIDKAVRDLPNMSVWVRRVITEAAQRELMNREEVQS